jgi:hypothetical protein
MQFVGISIVRLCPYLPRELRKVETTLPDNLEREFLRLGCSIVRVRMNTPLSIHGYPIDAGGHGIEIREDC